MLAGEVQRKTLTGLLDKLGRGEVTQKLLLTGPSGCGKTTIAKLYVEELCGSCDNIKHINCVDKSGVDYVRDEILPQLSLTPLFGEYQVIFADEIHGWSGKAQEALLVVLENLPSHVVFIAATTEPEKVNSTLSSRLNVINLPVPSRSEITKFMISYLDDRGIAVKDVSKIENPKLTITKDVAASIVDRSNGNMRSVVAFLDQVSDGIYSSSDAEESLETSLIKTLLYEAPTVEKLFEIASNISDYNGQVNSMCSYAISAMKNPKIKDRCIAILTIFGCGLSPYVSPRVSFHNLLIKYSQLDIYK
jgi:DNA polymerase III gamma/tau subunit